MNEHASSQLVEQACVNLSNLGAEDRRDYVERLVRARCGDVITEADLASLGNKVAPDAAMIPREVGQRIEDALEVILARIDRLESRLDGRRPH
jgi:hypothetical protein